MEERKAASSCKKYRIRSHIMHFQEENQTDIGTNDNRSRVKSEANTEIMRMKNKN